ncbi:hypothetical protein EK21DRAFT_109901 [Setomelanomma holmii]|uniref:Uncharacterized protein n=1 Tax=Setomelanomma holmii TaxID=210430 RepID=A0A9P4LMC7_9PLEO|nr:hypothetical protein EK21DRAFT_109901 [Setomelanomma holmii]
MSLGINNPTTLGIIRRALDGVGQQLTTTPYRFDPSSDGVFAILGSPNSARFAHFLIQRKNQIGLKTITAVWAFEYQSRSHAPCMLFNVGPLAAPMPRPQPQPPPQNPPPGQSPNPRGGGVEVDRMEFWSKSGVRRDPIQSREAATCGAPSDDVCAHFVYGNGTISQTILITDGGCTEVINPSAVSGIKVYDCQCNMWNAQSTAGCNNGNDETVDLISPCTGYVDRRQKGWQWDPTHVSCYRD